MKEKVFRDSSLVKLKDKFTVYLSQALSAGNYNLIAHLSFMQDPKNTTYKNYFSQKSRLLALTHRQITS